MRSGDRYLGKRSHETTLSFAAKTKLCGDRYLGKHSLKLSLAYAYKTQISVGHISF